MASTIPVGGYDPGTNDIPGMVPGRGAIDGPRNSAFLSSGTCSKLIRQLPQLGRFFSTVKKAINNLEREARVNSHAIQNLLQTQSNLNDNTNIINYWMRQVTPHLDQTNLQLVQANDALLGQSENDGPTDADQPGLPSSVTVLPYVEPGKVLVSWLPPNYSGSSTVASYEYKVFRTDGATTASTFAGTQADFATATINAITDALAKLTTTTGGFVEVRQDATGFHLSNLFDIYGAELRAMVISAQPTAVPGDEISICMRALNTSGVGGANLPGKWTSPTLDCLTLSNGDSLAPVVHSVVTGVNYHLIQWNAASKIQSDGAPSEIAGIYGYNINGTLVTPPGPDPAYFPDLTTAGCGVQVSGTRNICQIPVQVLGSNIISTSDHRVYVTACADIATSTPGSKQVALTNGRSTDFTAFTLNLTVPPPRISVNLRSKMVSAASEYYVSVSALVPDFYEQTAITYTVFANDLTSPAGNPALRPKTISSSTPLNISQPALSTFSVSVSVPNQQDVTPTYLTKGHSYNFTAQAAVSGGFTSAECVSVGPFDVPSS
jgi:hypothetical protein